MTTNINTLLPRVSPYLRDCAEAVELAALRETARDFLEETEAWRETIEGLTTIEGETEYALVVPDSYLAVVKRVLWLKIADVEQGAGTYDVTPDGVLTLRTEPGEEDGLEMKVAVVVLPLATCVEYPEWLIARWGRWIVDGALWRLMAMAGKPWGDRESAAQRRAQYEDGVGRAKMELVTKNKNAALRSPFGKFAGR